MPKQVILDWDEYMNLCKSAHNYHRIFNSASAAVRLNILGAITEQDAKAYLLPILRILEENPDAD